MRTKEVILEDFKKAKEYGQEKKLSEGDQTEMLFLEASLDTRDELRGVKEALRRIEKALGGRGA